ncbi:hypothetical protein GVAV_000734 [Gurleya vavrai]
MISTAYLMVLVFFSKKVKSSSDLQNSDPMLSFCKTLDKELELDGSLKSNFAQMAQTILVFQYQLFNSNDNIKSHQIVIYAEKKDVLSLMIKILKNKFKIDQFFQNGYHRKDNKTSEDSVNLIQLTNQIALGGKFYNFRIIIYDSMIYGGNDFLIKNLKKRADEVKKKSFDDCQDDNRLSTEELN